MKITCLGGWAMPLPIMESLISSQFPDAERLVLYPGAGWQEQLPEYSDIIMGYSLGAFLLLKQAHALPEYGRKILLAPFIDFRQESGCGGKINVTQLKYLLRQLKKDSRSAINDFYARAGLPAYLIDELPYSQEDLIWGINQLIKEQTEADQAFETFLGDQDTLIDATVMKAHFPDIKIVAGAGHRLEALLPSINIV